MKAAFLSLVMLGACNACQPTSAPVAPTDQNIYETLVDAGCMKADPDGGVAAVAGERVLNPPVAWMNCLAGGGTVAGCNVPCSK